MRRFLRSLSPWRYECERGGARCWRGHAWRPDDGAPWCPMCNGDVVRVPSAWSIIAAAAMAMAFVVLVASRADAQQWTGSLQWRNEVIKLVSCCGPLKAPVVTRQLEKGYAVARADLDAAGFRHVPLPPLGTREHPYTIEVRSELPDECKDDCPKGFVCWGCSLKRLPQSRPRWTHVVVVDKATGRAAPVNHEARHRWCALLRPRLVSTVDEIFSGGVAKACAWADHPIDNARRYNVLGQAVPKEKP